MARLRLAFLGAPTVWLDHGALSFPTRKALALLIYLAMEPGLHTREKLVTLFWPERDESSGRPVLRTTLAYLRRALDSAVPQSSKSYLQIEPDRLGFKPKTAVQIDVHALFEPGEPGAVLDQVRGEFLEGFTLPDTPDFDEWVRLQRERCHRQISGLWEQLSRQQLAQRQAATAVDSAVRWLAHDPLNEAAHRRLIECHLLTGDKAAALHAYTHCRTTLKIELGLEPDAATRALVNRLDSEIAVGPLTWVGKTASPEALPFVGRLHEHVILTECFHAAALGQPQVVTIEGEAGIGKTRLATEFLRWTGVQRSDIWQGRAFEAGGRLPYQPISDALRQRLERENAPDDLLSDLWLAELARLLPELVDRYPDLPSPVQDETLARTRLLEAVVRLGMAVSGHEETRSQKAAAFNTLVFFIDDLQWADEASLDLLQYALRRWQEQQTPLLLLLTVRSESLETTPSLRAWLAHLGRSLPLNRLEIGPITADETAKLVAMWQKRSEQQVDSSLADWLYRETTGQPFYIAETLKALQARGLPAELSQSFIPTTVRQLILTRLQGLSIQATELLTAAAVIGRRCRFERLCQVAEQSDEAGLAALDTLLVGHLLSETADLNRPYQFAHDKIRDIVYTEAGDARRRVYHRRAFQVLLQDQAPAAELAHHALAAHLPESAFRYSVAAGDAAISLFAIGNAIAHYEQARQVADGRWRAARDDLHHLFAQLARAYELNNQYDMSKSICEEMLSVGRRDNQPALICGALNRLASIAIYTHHLSTAESHLQQALQIASKSENKALLTQTHWSLSQLTHHQGEFRASKEHAERALTLARELEDAPLIAGTLNSLGHAQGLLGDLAACEATMTEAANRFQQLGNKALEADSLVGLTLAHLLQGKPQAGIVSGRRAYAIGCDIENEFGQCMSRPWLAFGLADSGAFDEALSLARENLEAARPQGGPPLLLAALSLGLVYWFLGLADDSKAAHQENEAVITAVGVRNYVAQYHANLCAAAVLGGEWDAAGDLARRSLAHQDYTTVPLIYVPLWPLTAALLYTDAFEQARTDVQRWTTWIGAVPRYQITYLRSLALLAERDGQPDQAVIHLERALKLAEQMGLPGEQWQLLTALAHRYSDASQAEAAKSQADLLISHAARQFEDKDIQNQILAAKAFA